MTIKNITHLKILGKDYKVEWFTPDPLITQEISGRQAWNEGKILIDGTLDEWRSLDILLHETIHALNDDMKIGLDEDMTNRLGAGLQCIVRDNWKELKAIATSAARK